MAEAAKNPDLLKTLRDARDGIMDTSAKIVLGITGSRPYQRVQGLFLKPTFLWLAMTRKFTEGVMSDALARLNMPSREEVLSLSTRMTNIEMALDDMAAMLDQVRRASSQPQRPSRSPAREPRDTASETRTLSAKEA